MQRPAVNSALPAHRRQVQSPQFPGPINAEIHARPGHGQDDEANTAQTVAMMASFVLADRYAPAVMAATRQAIAEAGPNADPIEAIFSWLKRNVQFQEDATTAFLAGLPSPFDAEILIRPADILAMPEPKGDCDDHTMLAASMLLNIPAEVRFVTIEQAPEMPGLYSHIYAEVRTALGWKSFDASHGQHVGWFVPPVAGGKKRLWSLTDMHSSLGFAAPAATNTGINWGNIITDVTRTVANSFAVNRAPQFTAPTLPGNLPADRYGDMDIRTHPTEPISQQTLLFGGAALVLLIVMMNRR